MARTRLHVGGQTESSTQYKGSCPNNVNAVPFTLRATMNVPSHHSHISAPVMLENGAKAFINDDQIEVVTSRPGRAVTGRIKAPGTTRRIVTKHVASQAPKAHVQMVEAANNNLCMPEVVELVNLVSEDPFIVPPTSDQVPTKRQVQGHRRPRRQATKKSINNNLARGNDSKKEDVVKSSSTASSMSVVPSLVLIDKSQVPARIFHRGELLGSGGFAKVYKVTERASGQTFADKVINKEIFVRRTNARDKVEREILLHRRMNHSNIIKFYDFFEDTNFVHLVLELASQGSLLNVSRTRKTLTEPEVRYYFRQIAAGTRYIHGLDILHRDLKLGNMFLSEHMEIKIGDFGLSTTQSENTPSLCGTPNYVSPEIIAKKGHSVASEVWSIGCILYALLCGKPPFDSDSVETTYKLITIGQYNIPDQLSPAAVDFLQQFLHIDSSKRGTLESPVKVQGNRSLLAHPFMTQGFIPTVLPPTAVSEAPVLAELTQGNTRAVLSPSPSSSVRQDNPSGGCSPRFSLSFKRMKTFFNPRNEFLEQALVALEHFMIRKRENVYLTQPKLQIPNFVSKWVDFTNRFGFIYKMADRSMGVLFNDTTKLGVSSQGKIDFTDMKGRYHVLASEEANRDALSEVSSRMAKLESYVKYMEECLNDTYVDEPIMEMISIGQKTLIPQLKRWHRTGLDYIGMEFNNNMVQVNFKVEHIKIIIWMFENEMFLTSIFSGRVETFSLDSQSRGLMRPRTASVLPEVATKIRELLAIPIRD